MIDALIIGIGEYVTGLSGEKKADSDKSIGVVALALFDMRERGLINSVKLCGRDSSRFKLIEDNFNTNMKALYPNLDTSFEQFPKNEKSNEAYKDAIDSLKEGSIVFVFTPDDTHFKITQYALEKKMHVQVAKPLVKTFNEHQILNQIAQKNSLLCMLEVHKRYDPIYADARDKIQSFGGFSYYNSYMSQPLHQLDTFSSWAGISSDISYYLNSHHVDFLLWATSDFSKPISVYATASSGVGSQRLERMLEDTITLNVEWENKDGSIGTSIHTASWIAPKSDVHSQQRFFYMGHNGEINIDQAHRGYTMSDNDGFKSVNPLFWKYTPRDGKFVGQETYGYKSLETFVKSACEVNSDKTKLEDFNKTLSTITNTLMLTKILEAGRISLDEKRKVDLTLDW
jgi:D-galacturonate reductase